MKIGDSASSAFMQRTHFEMLYLYDTDSFFNMRSF